jgi:hypothetical protein
MEHGIPCIIFMMESKTAPFHGKLTEVGMRQQYLAWAVIFRLSMC